MITSAIQQIVNTDRTELKDFLNEVDKLHKTDEAVTAKIADVLFCCLGYLRLVLHLRLVYSLTQA
jgi:DNA-directed RNA polymerase subunit F